MISVLILTKNEQADLPGCLATLTWCDDIHILDSFSNDKTVEIAVAAGAKVTQRAFDGYASQRNFGLQELAYKHQWLLILDADEQVPDELKNTMLAAVEQAPAHVDGYRLRRRDYLWNTWLKHAQISPFYIRLIRLGKAKYHREINEVLEVEGSVLELPHYFMHYPFSKGITHWVSKHNTYSSMEAQRAVDELKGDMKFSASKALFSKDFSEKRYHQKGLYYKMPGRPFMKWVYIYFVRRGFLDGAAGFTYATLQSVYEWFIVLKTKEILKHNK